MRSTRFPLQSLRLAALCGALCTLLLAAGCNMFAPPADMQTLSADRITRGTEVAVLRSTATAQTERLRVTLDFAGTAVSNAGMQSTRIAATMIANGTAFVDLRFITPEAPVTAAPLAGNAPLNPIITAGGGAQGNTVLQPPVPTAPPLQTNNAAVSAATATPDPTRPSLTSVVVSESVGSDDCAVAPASSFTTAAVELYVVALAANLPAGSTITARWMRDNLEQVRYDWSPSFDIAQGCIWFRMPAGDVAFSAGSWSVQLDFNGLPTGTPTAFTLADESDDMMMMETTPES